MKGRNVPGPSGASMFPNKYAQPLWDIVWTSCWRFCWVNTTVINAFGTSAS